MDDLRERDLSNVPDEHLTPEELEELRRRFAQFISDVMARSGKKRTVAIKPKSIKRSDPVTASRRQ